MDWAEIKATCRLVWEWNPKEALAWCIVTGIAVLLFSFIMPLAAYALIGGGDD